MEDFQKEIYIQTLLQKGRTQEEINSVLSEGKFICPQCDYIFIPKYKTKKLAFETDNKEAREQWLSHICSNDCWKKLFGDYDHVKVIPGGKNNV